MVPRSDSHSCLKVGRDISGDIYQSESMVDLTRCADNNSKARAQQCGARLAAYEAWPGLRIPTISNVLQLSSSLQYSVC